MSKFTTRGGVSAKDVNQQALVKALATQLKKEGKLAIPDNVDVIKLSRHNELAPTDPDWYYTRAAAICRHLYFRKPAGVGALTKVFGGKKNYGSRPSHVVRSNKSVIRNCLQSLEKIGYVRSCVQRDMDADDTFAGRKLTAEGQRQLDRIAYILHKA